MRSRAGTMSRLPTERFSDRLPAVLLEKSSAQSVPEGMKIFFLSILSIFLGLSLLAASPQNPKGDAKITKNEAEHIALRQHHGARVTAAKLETVEGKLVWSIEVAQGENRTMVAVDAMTGRIVPPKDDRP